MLNEPKHFFVEKFKSWFIAPSSVSIRYLARKVDDVWKLQSAFILFGPKPLEIENKWAHNTSSIKAGVIQLNLTTIEDGEKLLSQIINGRLNIEEVALELPDADNKLDYYTNTIEHNPTFFEYLLKVQSQYDFTHEETFKIDEELRCANPVFDGMDDLTSFLGVTEYKFHTKPIIQITISPPIDIDISATYMDNNKINVGLIKHSNLAIENINLSVKLLPNPSIERRIRLPIEEINWETDFHSQTGFLTFPTSDTVMAQIVLTLNGSSVRKLILNDSKRSINPRYQAFRNLDSEKKLKEALENLKQSRDFEKAVRIIFHILGFSSCDFFETEAPDLILISPKGRILIVECTVQTHDIRTKAGKLHHRREELKESLMAEFPWIDVVAVLVCNQEKNKITEDKYLDENNIVLYSKEDVIYAIDYLLSAPGNPDEEIDKILARFSKNDMANFLNKN